MVVAGLDCRCKNTKFRGRADGRVNHVVCLKPRFTRGGQPALERKVHKLDHVWGEESTDADVYTDVGARMVRNVLAGRVSCCFAYGEVGGGCGCVCARGMGWRRIS